MKKRMLMTFMFCINCLVMLFPWFKGTDGNQIIYGTVMLENPIALTCLLFCIIGIWIDSHYGQVIETIGWIGFISMEIYEFLTWHIRIMGGNINLQLSVNLTYSHFYFAVTCAIISFIIYKISIHYLNKNRYKNVVCI